MKVSGELGRTGGGAVHCRTTEVMVDPGPSEGGEGAACGVTLATPRSRACRLAMKRDRIFR